jgi:hypothetical protein
MSWGYVKLIQPAFGLLLGQKWWNTLPPSEQGNAQNISVALEDSLCSHL